MTGEMVSQHGKADPDSLHSSVVRIVRTHGADDSPLVPVGLGILIADDLALTCAHVVDSALGNEDRSLTGDARVTLDLPLQHGPGRSAVRVTAVVERPTGDCDGLDLALLHLDQPLPQNSRAWMIEAGPQQLWGHSARVFGLPSDNPDGVWHQAVLRARHASGLVQADMVGLGHPVSEGFSGSPVWDQELGGVVGLIAQAEGGDLPVSYLVPTARVFDAWPDLRDRARPPSPFRGLSPFKEGDSGVFYGRRAEAADFARTVAQARWTTLLGPSGCGKSSMTMAGIIPNRRAAGDCVITLKPEGPLNPLRALAAALVPLLEPDLPLIDQPAHYDSIVANLVEHGLRDLARLALGQQDRSRLLIVIDQFEELLKVDASDVETFANALAPARLPDSVSVLAVLRADFLGPMLERPHLAALTETTKGTGEAAPALVQVHTLAPMRAEQIREIIELPVATIPGIAYGSGLVQRIIDDAHAEKGILPLLAYTLAELWKRQSGGWLTHEAYDDLGGVEGALKAAAGRAWDSIPDEDKPTAERLLTRLVWIPDGAEPPICRSATREELGESSWRIVGAFAAENLVILDSVENADGTTVETVRLAHDALITTWEELGHLIAANRELLTWLPSLRTDLIRWKNGGRSPDLLPPSVVINLADEKNWQSALSTDEREYLERGRAHHRSRSRRRRAAISGAAIVSALVLVFGSLFLYAQGQDNEHSAEANSRALAQVSQDDSATDPALSVLLAMAAYKTSPTQEARNQVLREYLAYSTASRVMSGLPGSVATFATSHDGNVVFAATPLGRTVLFVHAASGTIVSEPISAGYVVYTVVSPDGHRVAFFDDDGNAGWFNVDPNAAHPAGPIHKLPPAPQPVKPYYNAPMDAAAISSDGNLMAVADGSGGLLLWNLQTGTVTTPPAPPDAANGIWFSPDNRSLLVETYNYDFSSSDTELGLSVVALATGAIRTAVPMVDGQDILVSGDRSVVAVCRSQSSGDVLEMRRIADGSVIGKPYHAAEASVCQSSGSDAIDANGRWFAAKSSGGGGVDLIDMDQGKDTGSIQTPPDITSFSDQLVSAGANLYLAGQGATDITYTQLPTDTSQGVTFADNEALTLDGNELIDVLKDGSELQLRSSANGHVIAQAQRVKPFWVPTSDDYLRSDGDLLADREGADLVSIRQLPSLRQTALITIQTPPSWTSETSFSDFFDTAGHLITVSGTEVQEWDARTGRMLARFTDTAFHPQNDTNGEPEVMAAPSTAANQVVIVDTGDPLLRVVDLATGHVVTSFKTEDDVVGVQFDPSGQYFALLREGSQVELWRRNPLEKELGPLPSLTSASGTIDNVSADNPTGQAGPFAAGFIDNNGHFMIAANGTVHIYQVGDHSYTDYFDFSLPEGTAAVGSNDPYSFLNASEDGTELLYVDPSGNLGAIKLDPAAWMRTLCDVIGDRSFTDTDRASLPVGVPQQPVCSTS